MFAYRTWEFFIISHVHKNPILRYQNFYITEQINNKNKIFFHETCFWRISLTRFGLHLSVKSFILTMCLSHVWYICFLFKNIVYNIHLLKDINVCILLIFGKCMTFYWLINRLLKKIYNKPNSTKDFYFKITQNNSRM